MLNQSALTRNDPRHAANGGGSGQSIRVINPIDKDNNHSAMSTTGGERVIVNAVRANAGAIRQILSSQR